ncbi:MAG: response regulator [Alphaproteobacteria bacterium]
MRQQRRAPGLFAGAVLALLAVATVLLLQNLQSEETADARREFENLARTFDEHVSRIVKVTDQSMQAMRAAYEANPGRFSLSQWMSTNSVASDVLPQIAIIDKEGLVLTSSAATAGAAPVMVNDREHFQVHVGQTKDELFISKPVLGRVSGKWTIQLTRMLRDANGAFNGILVFSLDTAYFSRFYHSVSIGGSGQVFLVGTRDGTIRALAAPDDSVLALGDDIGDARLMSEIERNGFGSMVRHRVLDRKRISTVYAYRVLKDYPLAVVIGADARDYLAPFIEKRRLLIVSAFVVGLIVLGMAIWLSVKMRRLHDLEVKSVMLQLAAADERASLRTRAEEERRYRAATDAASDAIVSWGADGRMIFANPSARRIFGLADDQNIDDVYSAFFPPYERERIRQNVDALRRRAQGLGMTIEVEASRPNGGTFSAEVSLNRWAGGDGESITMVMRDISLRRKAEEEKKQILTQAMVAQKMEAIGTMAGGIAHDFNNVLGAMQGFIWLAKQDVPASGRAAQLLDKATQSGERAAHVVRQLLDFTRSQEPGRDVMNLSDTVKELADIAKASIPSTVTCTFHCEDGLFVNGDATHVHQMLLNLLINAQHAVDQTGNGRIGFLAERTLVREGHFGGGATLEGDTLPLVKSQWETEGGGGKLWYGSLPPGDYVCVSITDNGHGMSGDVMRRAFEPFFTTKPVGEGTGLGLSVMLGLVKAMRGGIVLSSKVGQGTQFKLYFPYAANAPEAAASAAPSPRPQAEARRRVLVVDDEKSLRDIVMSTLRMGGYEVDEAANGVEALALVAVDPQRWDLVLTDYSMPKMAGDRLADEIHALRADLPVILCTGRSDKSEQFAGLPLAAILAKPIFGQKLIAAIDQAITGKAAT